MLPFCADNSPLVLKKETVNKRYYAISKIHIILPNSIYFYESVCISWFIITFYVHTKQNFNILLCLTVIFFKFFYLTRVSLQRDFLDSLPLMQTFPLKTETKTLPSTFSWLFVIIDLIKSASGLYQKPLRGFILKKKLQSN